MKKVAILQSNYVPWKGYFDLINMVDLFIFHDDLQYTKNDWRNRNKIIVKGNAEWLTIPCGTSEKRLICDVNLDNHNWQAKHWNKIFQSYSKAKYFHLYEEVLSCMYLEKKWKNLSEFNQHLIRWLSEDILYIRTSIVDSRHYLLTKQKSERVLELLKCVNATTYLSGPAAKNYLDLEGLNQQGISVEWMDYSGYAEYSQMTSSFIHEVSILDLIFNCGPNSRDHLKSTGSI